MFVKTHYTKLISQGQWLEEVACYVGGSETLLVKILNALQMKKQKQKQKKKNKKGERTAGNIIINNMQTRRNQCKTR